MKKYEALKNSGVDWIGEIPKSWDVIRLKYVSENNPSNVDKKSEADEKSIQLCNYVDVYKNDYISKRISFMEATASEIQIEKFGLRKGFVIATKDSETPVDIANPAYVVEDMENVVCGYHLTLMKPHESKLDGKFLFNLFKSPRMNSFFEINARGVTRFGLPTSAFNDVYIPLPSLKEQTTIANYLDHKTSQLDTLITKKEKLIELLQEERTAIINHAVTKGLDPNVPMKDSGIEWLGEIPEHWTLSKLCYMTSKIGDGLHGTPNYVDDSEYFFINGNNIGEGGIKLTEQTKRVSLNEFLINRKDLTERTILLSINGTIGNLTFYKGEKVMLGKSAAYINCIDEVSKEYIYYYLKSKTVQIYFDLELSGSTIKNLSLYAINKTPIAIPRLPEQIAIVKYIESSQNRINKILVKIEDEVELLEEYKTALISGVVTGKVDVRDEILNW